MAERWWRVVPGVGLAVLVAGCVSMPGSGPPVKYHAESGTGQNQVYIVPHPEPPGPNSSPTDIVQGFLSASAFYASGDQPARGYLTTGASQAWQPDHEAATVLEQTALQVSQARGSSQATVWVSGSMLVSLTGTGSVATQSAQTQSSSSQSSQAAQSQSAQSHPSGQASYKFGLVKVGGQWRIDQLPKVLVLAQKDFTFAYQAQNVYYVPSGQSEGSRLVPDTVYVPLGTTENDLLTRLVNTILTSPGDWLQNAAQTSIQGTKLISAYPSYQTAVVNLTGTIAYATPAQQQQMAAQLAYTLVGSPGLQADITAVVMEINGVQSAVTGIPPVPLSDARYQPYDPYPPQAAPFTYVDPGTHAAQSRCGAAQAASIVGQAVAVFGPGGAQLASCASAGSAPSATATPPAGKHGSRPAPTQSAMVLASPDGNDIATVSVGRDSVAIWPVGAKRPGPSVSVPGVSSMSWDQMHDLWIVTPDGDIDMVTAAGKLVPAGVKPGLTELSIAPDGVRVAMVVSGQLQLAAIGPAESTQNQAPRSNQSSWVIGPSVPISPGVSQVRSMTWYDRDNLVVVSGNTAQNALVEAVPVNGGVVDQTARPAKFSVPVGRYPVAIAANSSQNVLVVVLDNHQLEVATGIDGPAQILGPGVLGDAPAYGGPG